MCHQCHEGFWVVHSQFTWTKFCIPHFFRPGAYRQHPGSMSGYGVDADAAGSRMIELKVLCLSGESLIFRVPCTALGREVRELVSKQLSSKKGRKLALHHGTSPLVFHQSLQEQGVVGETAALSCTFAPTDFCAAWCFVSGEAISDDKFALEGLTCIDGAPYYSQGSYFRHLPQSREKLTFNPEFNSSLEGVSLPNALQSLAFGHHFNLSMKGVSLPKSP